MTAIVTLQSRAEAETMRRSQELHRCAYAAMAGILALSILIAFAEPRIDAAIGKAATADLVLTDHD